jgi:hypothetical protein
MTQDTSNGIAHEQAWETATTFDEAVDLCSSALSAARHRLDW